MRLASLLPLRMSDVRKRDAEEQAMPAPAKTLFAKYEIRLALIAAIAFVLVAGVSLFI